MILTCLTALTLAVLRIAGFKGMALKTVAHFFVAGTATAAVYEGRLGLARVGNAFWLWVAFWALCGVEATCFVLGVGK